MLGSHSSKAQLHFGVNPCLLSSKTSRLYLFPYIIISEGQEGVEQLCERQPRVSTHSSAGVRGILFQEMYIPCSEYTQKCHKLQWPFDPGSGPLSWKPQKKLMFPLQLLINCDVKLPSIFICSSAEEASSDKYVTVIRYKPHAVTFMRESPIHTHRHTHRHTLASALILLTKLEISNYQSSTYSLCKLLIHNSSQCCYIHWWLSVRVTVTSEDVLIHSHVMLVC